MVSKDLCKVTPFIIKVTKNIDCLMRTYYVPGTLLSERLTGKPQTTRGLFPSRMGTRVRDVNCPRSLRSEEAEARFKSGPLLLELLITIIICSFIPSTNIYGAHTICQALVEVLVTLPWSQQCPGGADAHSGDAVVCWLTLPAPIFIEHLSARHRARPHHLAPKWKGWLEGHTCAVPRTNTPALDHQP